MTGRTRYFVVGSSLVLVVGLCTGLVAYYSSSLPFRSSTAGPAELSYVPSATATLAFADVRDLMASEFRQKLREVHPAEGGKNVLMEEIGIDIERDVESVLVAFGDGGHPLAFVRGTFDPAVIERRAVARGARVESYQGKTLYVVVETASTIPQVASNASGPVAIALLESNLLAVGTEGSLKSAIDTGISHADVTANAELMKLVSDVQNDGNAWLVGDVSSFAGPARAMVDQVQQRVPGLHRFAVSAQVDCAVNARMRAQTTDQKAADDLRAMVNGLISAGRMMGSGNPQLTALLDSIRATGAGDTVEISFTVPASALDNLGDAANLFRAPPPSPR